MIMEIVEFATIAMALKAAYPSANIMPDDKSKNVWFTMLQDLDYGVCLNAVKELISLNKFAPSISEIREKCINRTHNEIKDWGTAWGSVERAISRYGMYQPDEALNSLDLITRQIVKRMGFRNLCTSDNQVADRAHFSRMYESLAIEYKQSYQLSDSLRNEKQKLIESLVGDAVYTLEQKLLNQ